MMRHVVRGNIDRNLKTWEKKKNVLGKWRQEDEGLILILTLLME